MIQIYVNVAHMLINSLTEMSVSHMLWVNIVMLKYYSFSDRLITGYQKLYRYM